MVRGVGRTAAAAEAANTEPAVLEAEADADAEPGVVKVGTSLARGGERDCVVSLGTPALRRLLFTRPQRGFTAARF
jgi:hypothetical protein